MNIQNTNHLKAGFGYVSPAMDMQEFYTEGVLSTSFLASIGCIHSCMSIRSIMGPESLGM